MSKTKLFATLAVFVVIAALGWLYYGNIMPDFYEAHTGSAEGVSSMPPDILLLSLGQLLTVFMMVHIYEKWAANVYSATNGMLFGIYVGILLGIGLGLIWYATSNIWDATAAIVEAIWTVVYFGIAGLVMGLVYSKTSSQ